mgnify:CR=1 FL=1
MSPSYHHGYVCLNVGSALKQFEQYAVFSELTLAIDKDYIPDICIYPKRTINFAEKDIIRMTEMPVGVVEVTSPTQTPQDLLEKFDVYFEAGVQSCWLVVPPTMTVTVYRAPNQGQIFHTGEIVDPVLEIRIPINVIFE